MTTASQQKPQNIGPDYAYGHAILEDESSWTPQWSPGANVPSTRKIFFERLKVI
jgi:hypothetical protein